MKEVFRIEVPIEVQDKTEPAVARAQQRLTAFERTAQRTEQQLNRMNRTRWQLTLSALDRASSVIDRVSSSVSALTRRSWQISIGVASAPFRALDWIWSRLTSIQGLVTAFLAGQAFRGGVLSPLEYAGQLQQAQIGFTTFLGSAEKAQEFMQRLQRFGAETPFEMDQLVRLGTQLLPVFRGDVDMVMRTLKAFGDAAALTGAGVQGMELALLGFRQIATVGKLSLEELRQVTENLMVPLDPIIQELGITNDQLADLGKQGIPASRAMEAILRALERPVSRGGFAGGMAVQMETLFGQVSMLRDTITQSLVQPWGRGLLSVVVPALKRVNEWLDHNSEKVSRWGQALEKAARDAGQAVVGWFERGFARLHRLMDDPRWQRADLFGKISLAWDEVIARPFERWWHSGGQTFVQDAASKIGGGLGSAIGSFMMAALGVVDQQKIKDESPFVQAGATAGKAFLDAFLEAFDADQIAGRLVDAVKGMAREAAKIFPGGDRPTAMSWVSAGLLGYAGIRLFRLGRGVFQAGRAGVRTVGALGRAIAQRGAAAPEAGAGFADVAQATAPAAQQAGRFSRWIEALRSSPVLSKIGGVLGRVGFPLAILGGLTEVAMARPGERLPTGARVAGGIAGAIVGAKAGASVGTMMAPGLGTAIGGALGGIAGGVLGSLTGQRFGEWIDRLGPKLEAIKSTVASTLFSPEWWAGKAGFVLGVLEGTLFSGEWWMARWEGVLAWARSKWDQAASIWNSALDTISSTLFSAQWWVSRWESVKSWTASAWDSISTLFGSIRERIENTLFSEKWWRSKWSALQGWVSEQTSGLMTRFEKVRSAFESGREAGRSAVAPSRSAVATSGPIAPHAEGGIFSRPHIGLVAESGPEAIIPLAPSRRSRALALWEAVGERIGGRTKVAAQVLTAGASPVAVSVQPGAVSITVTVQGGDGDQVIDAIRRHGSQIARELTDKIALELGVRMRRVMANMPKGGV